tara:strand:+ start:5867 stop:7153 length:1287 start_codon:yes stop_codon:yes gene_type:complete
MPVQGRTRKQLRQSIGYNLGALKVGNATGGTNNTLIDVNTFRGGDDTYNGKLVLVTDASDGTTQTTQYVNDYTASNNTIQFQQNASFTVASSDEYELWDEPYDPAVIHDFINQAIIDATGQAYDPVENPDMSSSPHTALFADGKVLRFDIPSNISIINRLYYRSSISFTRLHSCNAAFDETVDSDITVTVDTEDKKQGTGSNKFVIASGASAGDIATDSITSKDISKYDYLEGWIKSTVATSAGNLKILLDDSASCASPLETLSVPALSADTWTYFRVALANPETDTAIISIGLEYDADLNACQVRLDDLKVVQNDTAIWEIFPKHLWKIDRSSRDLVLTDSGKFEAGYSMLKIVGGDKPALLSAETTATEVDDSYIIARATGLAFAASSGGANTDPDQKRQQAAFWLGLAEQAKRAFPLLITGRVVE